MQQVVLLDANPLSEVVHPKIKLKVKNWMQFLKDNDIALKAPEISVYELRRELIRLNNNKSINRLNRFISYSLIQIDSETFEQAAMFWAEVRKQGKPTADDRSLDCDAILAAQALQQFEYYHKVAVITTNVKHIERFAVNNDLEIIDWVTTLNSF
jgi:predicted nucleic acid-binding protein